MTRTFAMYVVPFLLPLAAYLVWAWYRQRHVVSHGGEAPPIEKGPWPYFLLAGALLTLSIAGIMALTRGADPGSDYTPARIENGKIVPGTTKSSDEDASGPRAPGQPRN